MSRTVLITGAAGNIGRKVTAHLTEVGGYDLRLLDLKGGGDIVAADFSSYDESWARAFEGVDTVLHFAGDPRGNASWASVLAANVAGTQNVLRAARAAKIRRVVFASTNQIMLGYRFKDGPVTTDMAPAPLSPYGISKLFGEQIGRAFFEETGISFVALRIGYFQGGDNQPGTHMGIGEWGQSMWLSNGDMNRAIDAAIACDAGFAVVNLESSNKGMRWDLDHSRDAIGYVPQDGAPIQVADNTREMDRVASGRRVVPGTWLNESFEDVEP